jgi:hypothetical protein
MKMLRLKPRRGRPDPAPKLIVAVRRTARALSVSSGGADGSAETRDIKFVSFFRKRTSDQPMQNCPEHIPRGTRNLGASRRVVWAAVASIASLP